MSKAEKRRLRVFIRVTDLPLRVDMEFLDDKLADCYRRTVPENKKVLAYKSSTLRIEMPTSVIDLEMSRSLGAMVVHFDHVDNAKTWIDDIWLPVQSQGHQVYIKQYWNDTDFSELSDKLREKRRLKDLQEGISDRAGNPPGPAKKLPDF